MKSNTVHLLLFCILSFAFQLSKAQVSLGNDNSANQLYAKVKNIEEFISRFNYEKDFLNNPVTEEFRNRFSRQQIIESLFNNDTASSSSENYTTVSEALKDKFIKDVVQNNRAIHKDSMLFAHVTGTFLLNKSEIKITLLMRYVEDGQDAFRWIIKDVKSEALAISGFKNISEYIPPNADDLDFMNMHRAFADGSSTINFTDSDFNYSQLSIFLYLIESGQLVFKKTNSMSYTYKGLHPYEIDLQEYNRAGYNSGWLISSIRETKN